MHSILILSTLPHYASAYILPEGIITLPYIICIVASTTASIVWHIIGEPTEGLVYMIDYGLAGLWFIFDICMASYIHRRQVYLKILLLNGIVFYLHIIHSVTNKSNDDYYIYHSVWHLVSSAKAFYISRTISKQL